MVRPGSMPAKGCSDASETEGDVEFAGACCVGGGGGLSSNNECCCATSTSK